MTRSMEAVKILPASFMPGVKILTHQEEQKNKNKNMIPASNKKNITITLKRASARLGSSLVYLTYSGTKPASKLFVKKNSVGMSMAVCATR